MKKYIIIGCSAVFTLLIFFSISGLYNSAIRQEKNIVATYEDMKNVLSQYSLKVAETAQIPTMYKDDLKEVYSSAISGRYGTDGSKAMMNWIKEHNPNFDSSLYKQIQQVIESGRNNFENKQRLLIDNKRQYETTLSYFFSGSILRILGFPRIQLSDYKIVESKYSQESFSIGTAEAIRIRGQ